MTAKAAQQRIEATAAALSEHFDSVQIFVSFPLHGATQAIQAGRGDWYARQGMAHEFIQRDRAAEIAFALKSE